ATPAGLGVVPGAVELGGRGGAKDGEVAPARRRVGHGDATGEPTRAVAVDELPQQSGEFARVLIAAQLEHGPGVAGEDRGRRPAPVGVALGDIRTNITINTNH